MFKGLYRHVFQILILEADLCQYMQNFVHGRTQGTHTYENVYKPFKEVDSLSLIAGSAVSISANY